LGQAFIPDNRTGAGGTVGLAMVAKAPPDGYTVMVASPDHRAEPALYSNLPYDTTKDFTPIARLASIENVMLVHPSVPAKTLKEFIALARAKPGKLNYGLGRSRHDEPPRERAAPQPREDQHGPRAL
jgi:tripartite-type tricarboxylate transporter receptor subunit TctC